jgi:DNA-binding CsgD family transcriptional regulator
MNLCADEAGLVEPLVTSRLPLEKALSIWVEICADSWHCVSAMDIGDRRFAIMERKVVAATIDWNRLTCHERQIVASLANDESQKAIGFKLGLAPSTVSGAVASAMRRLGMRSAAQMVRAYCARSAYAALQEVGDLHFDA